MDSWWGIVVKGRPRRGVRGVWWHRVGGRWICNWDSELRWWSHPGMSL